MYKYQRRKNVICLEVKSSYQNNLWSNISWLLLYGISTRKLIWMCMVYHRNIWSFLDSIPKETSNKHFGIDVVEKDYLFFSQKRLFAVE